MMPDTSVAFFPKTHADNGDWIPFDKMSAAQAANSEDPAKAKQMATRNQTTSETASSKNPSDATKLVGGALKMGDLPQMFDQSGNLATPSVLSGGPSQALTPAESILGSAPQPAQYQFANPYPTKRRKKLQSTLGT